jgi:hypothetical protein
VLSLTPPGSAYALAALPPLLQCVEYCSYPFEIHDDALVLKKMLEHEEMQQRVAGAAAAAAAGRLVVLRTALERSAANNICRRSMDTGLL